MVLTSIARNSAQDKNSLIALPLEPTANKEPIGVGEAQEEIAYAVRYERGSRVYATDGPVGTLRQVVVDEDMGEVKAIVVRLATKKESVLVPPDLVEKSVDGALVLNVTKAQFGAGASRSPRFDKQMFTAADPRRIAESIPLMFKGDRRRSVARLSRDYVEASDVIADSLGDAPSTNSRPRWWPFRRRSAARERRVDGSSHQ